MKILYVTDIHGIEWKHNKIFELASSLKPDVVINGGDMLTFKGNLLHQDKFITDFLDEYFSRFESMKIYYLGMLGNDDLKIFDDLFQETCDKYSYVATIAQKKFQIKGSEYEFIGMNWIPDLPFGLKDRARKDSKDFKFPKQVGKQYRLRHRHHQVGALPYHHHATHDHVLKPCHACPYAGLLSRYTSC